MAEVQIEVMGPGPLEAETVVANNMLTVKPIFYGTGREPANAAILRVKYGDDVLHTYVLRIHGGSLQLNLHNRTKPVEPIYQRKRRPKGGGEKPPEARK